MYIVLHSVPHSMSKLIEIRLLSFIYNYNRVFVCMYVEQSFVAIASIPLKLDVSPRGDKHEKQKPEYPIIFQSFR